MVSKEIKVSFRNKRVMNTYDLMEEISSRMGIPLKEDKELHFAGYDFTSGPKGTKIHRDRIHPLSNGDYGSDPLGDGKFRMVPSGDVVDQEERDRRLKKYRK